MIRCALSLLTAIAVLWHATAGCCAHHDHAAADKAEVATSCCGHSHSHGDDPSHRHDACEEGRSEKNDSIATLGHPDDSHGVHCGKRCSFPQSEDTGVSLVKQTLASCDLALPVATLLYAFEATPANDPPAFESPPPLHAGGALRRHLALGVLLI